MLAPKNYSILHNELRALLYLVLETCIAKTSCFSFINVYMLSCLSFLPVVLLLEIHYCPLAAERRHTLSETDRNSFMFVLVPEECEARVSV